MFRKQVHFRKYIFIFIYCDLSCMSTLTQIFLFIFLYPVFYTSTFIKIMSCFPQEHLIQIFIFILMLCILHGYI